MSALEVPVSDEWLVCDYKNIPSNCLVEYDLSKKYFEYQQVIDSSYVDEGDIKAGVEPGIPPDIIEDAYYGQYENDEDLACEQVESTGMFQDVPDSVTMYFDYTAFGRDLAFDSLEQDGYYFSAGY